MRPTKSGRIYTMKASEKALNSSNLLAFFDYMRCTPVNALVERVC